VIAIDPTHHQAWSALGGIFAKKRMKREALFAFREACKLQSHNAELWMHAALAALDLGHFHEAIYAAKLSLDYGGAPAPQISSLVAQAVVKDLKDAGDGRRTRMLVDRCRALLMLSTQRAPTHAVHWEARLHLEQKCGASDEGAATREVLEEQLEAYKAHAPWKTNNDALEQVAEVAAQLVESQLESGEVPLLRKAKATVDALLYAAGEKLAASPGCEQLRMLMSRIQRHDDDD
jgi:tetratricopeptide (TPR) repeat protein